MKSRCLYVCMSLALLHFLLAIWSSLMSFLSIICFYISCTTCCEQQGVAQGGNMKYLAILLHEPKLETAACTGTHMYMLSVSTHTEYTPGSLDMLSLWHCWHHVNSAYINCVTEVRRQSWEELRGGTETEGSLPFHCSYLPNKPWCYTKEDNASVSHSSHTTNKM